MFDAQAWYIRDVILGKITVPAVVSDMKADDAPWEEKEGKLETDEDMIRFKVLMSKC